MGIGRFTLVALGGAILTSLATVYGHGQWYTITAAVISAISIYLTPARKTTQQKGTDMTDILTELEGVVGKVKTALQGADADVMTKVNLILSNKEMAPALDILASLAKTELPPTVISYAIGVFTALQKLAAATPAPPVSGTPVPPPVPPSVPADTKAVKAEPEKETAPGTVQPDGASLMGLTR